MYRWTQRYGLKPFRLGNPAEKLKTLLAGPALEIERALTESERRKRLAPRC